MANRTILDTDKDGRETESFFTKTLMLNSQRQRQRKYSLLNAGVSRLVMDVIRH
jgi:hypothetical protein